MWVVKVPTSVQVTKKKKFHLNLNAYRNAHHFTLDKAKKEFDSIVQPLLGNLPQMEAVKLTYTLFTGTRQLVDTANVCTVVDKFFSDSLVHSGKIEDDNYTIVLSVDFRYGGYDKSDPRVEVTIEPVSTTPHKPYDKEEHMQITIVEAEIKTAIRNYILSQINVNEDMDIEIDLRATRGETGYQAFIDILPSQERVANQKKEEPKPAPTNLNITGKVRETRGDTKTRGSKDDGGSDDKESESTRSSRSASESRKGNGEAPQQEDTPDQVKAEKTETQDEVETTAINDDSEEETPKVKTASIFANLKKPVNA